MKRCILCGLPSDIGMIVTMKDGRIFHFECGYTYRKASEFFLKQRKEKRGNR